MSYENFFREYERKKKEEEERRRQEEERRRREEEMRRQAEEKKRREEEQRRREIEEREERRKLQVAAHFDSDIKEILRSYGNVKMKSGLFVSKRVDGPRVTSESVYWSLRCAGYNGVEITLHLRKNARGELEPDHFTISGIWGGRNRASLSIQDLLDALADSSPQEYTPPSSYSDYSSCVCNMGIC